MKEQIIEIAEKLKNNTITTNEAQNLLLDLFGVIKTLCPQCGNEKPRLWRLCSNCYTRNDEE